MAVSFCLICSPLVSPFILSLYFNLVSYCISFLSCLILSHLIFPFFSSLLILYFSSRLSFPVVLSRLSSHLVCFNFVSICLILILSQFVSNVLHSSHLFSSCLFYHLSCIVSPTCLFNLFSSCLGLFSLLSSLFLCSSGLVWSFLLSFCFIYIFLFSFHLFILVFSSCLFSSVLSSSFNSLSPLVSFFLSMVSPLISSRLLSHFCLFPSLLFSYCLILVLSRLVSSCFMTTFLTRNESIRR